MGLLPVPGEGPWLQREQEGAAPVGERVQLEEVLRSTVEVEVEVEVRRSLLQQSSLPLPEEGAQGWVGAPRLCPPWEEVLAERVKQQQLRAAEETEEEGSET